MLQIIEKILFRRALENRLVGYTLDTAIEISDTLTRHLRVAAL